MPKHIYVSSLENINELPSNSVAIVISKNAHKKLNRKILKENNIQIKLATKLIPSNDIIAEYKETKKFELFRAAYVYDMLKNNSSTLDNIFSYIMNSNKQVFIVTKGKKIKKNLRKVVAELFFARYRIVWKIYVPEVKTSQLDSYLEQYQKELEKENTNVGQ